MHQAKTWFLFFLLVLPYVGLLFWGEVSETGQALLNVAEGMAVGWCAMGLANALNPERRDS